MEMEVAQASEILSRTPKVLNSLLFDLPDAWIRANEGANTWSPFDVMGHLIHAEEADWIPRIEIILRHGETVSFTPFDREAQFQKSIGKSLFDLLGTFEMMRRENLAKLKGFQLTADHLDAKGTHPEFGAVTLSQLIATWVVHDLSHIAQINRVMCKQYAEAVGPWKAYLPILTR